MPLCPIIRPADVQNAIATVKPTGRPSPGCSRRSRRTVVIIAPQYGAPAHDARAGSLRPDMELEGRVAIVTGGGTGLGAEICHELARAGARVAVNFSRSEAEATSLADGLPTRSVAVRADVRNDDEVRAMVTEVEQRLDGPVSLLVNNAGVTTYVPAADLDAITDDDWHRILDVNLVGTWRCARAVAAGMRERGEGAIVNVASDAAVFLEGSSIPYVVSKVGVVALTRILATTLTPIRVNAVEPGWMDTPWLDRYVPDDVADALRSGDEPTVEVVVVAREIVRLLADDAASGEVVQL
jgi:3-oxoacyl-[acyl-carrier protein] reductase